MQSNSGRQMATLILIVGAVIFGLVLAGSTQLTPVANAQSGNAPAKAVVVPPSVTGNGLPSFADLAEAVSPAVASIQVTTIERGPSRRGGGIDPFEFFFGPRQRDPRQQQPQQERRSDSSGSGFVISSDGLVVTNHHVIEGSSGLKVILGDREYSAEIKGDDPATDLALLKIDTDEELTYLELGDSDELRVGDWVMAIGSPLTLQNSVSVGVVSAKGRSINITADASLENFIQTDAAINFGNSGGPLVDLSGRVVGIATAINYGAENIGFAVPVATLQRILPQLRDSGSVRRGYLGVNIADLDRDLAESFGLESTEGTVVTEVRAGGPSEEAGIQHGDIILGVDGRKIHNNRELIDYISSLPPETKVELDIFRNGDRLEKTITLGQRPLEDGSIPEAPAEEEAGSIDWLGIQFRDLDDEIRDAQGIPSGVTGVIITQVEADSPLYENVARGVIIAEVNGEPISGGDEFRQIVGDAESGAVLRLYIRTFGPQGSASGYAVVRKP